MIHSPAPIALFVYNRLEHTKRTVIALQNNPEAKHSKLFIFSDGAKSEKDIKAVEQVRQYIHQIDGFSEVSIREQKINSGLANSIIEGVTQLCEEFERVIVLEDDLLVSPAFLNFMNTSLDLYENDEKIMQVAGYMFPIDLRLDYDSLLLPYTSSWGWATWKSAWDKFDKDGVGFEKLKNSKKLRSAFDLGASYSYYKMLSDQQKGKVESWAIRWYLSVFLNQGLVLYPKKTLVNNIGFDGTGENCIASRIDELKIEEGFNVESFPREIKVSDSYEEIKKAMIKPKLNLISLANLFKRRFIK